MTSTARGQARLVVQWFSNEFEQHAPCVGMLRVSGARGGLTAFPHHCAQIPDKKQPTREDSGVFPKSSEEYCPSWQGKAGRREWLGPFGGPDAEIWAQAQMQRTGNAGTQLAFCISPWVFLEMLRHTQR